MIELSRVCKTYETGSKAVKDISLTIDDGEFVFIVGRSGSCLLYTSCPYGVLKSDRLEHKEIMKCNMCVHRTEDGSPKPMCVEICPMNAITLEEVDV